MGKATYTVTVTNNSNGVSVDYETCLLYTSDAADE